jgi:5-hydroxyisourate hydrolase
VSVSTHVLDTTSGRPAAGLSVELNCWVFGRWTPFGIGATDADGRVRDWADTSLSSGVYQLSFGTGRYFGDQGTPTLYPYVTVVFEITDPASHYHVPLLLSPYAYSTYRGS